MRIINMTQLPGLSVLHTRLPGQRNFIAAATAFYYRHTAVNHRPEE